MSNLKTRLEVLEKKMITNFDNGPDCVIICAESGRPNAEADTSEICRLTCNNINYDREPQETEENFVTRVAALAKAKLPAKGVPALIAFSQNMLAETAE